MNTYKSQAARDAQAAGYGDESYWQYLDDHAQELFVKFMNDETKAKSMLTRSLSEALDGNDGD